MLKLRFKNNKHNAVWLVEPKVTIGRAASNNLVVDDVSVAENHAEIIVEHETLTLKNTSGSTELFVNSKVVGSAAPVAVNDVIVVGKVQLQVVDPKAEVQAPATIVRSESEVTGWSIKSNHSALSNRVFPLKVKNIVGRSNDCDITLAAAHLSRRHAEMTVREGQLYVKDLGSANGTYINGTAVEANQEVRVKRGDDLRFDTLSFGVIGPADDLDKTTVRSLSAEDLKPQTKGANEKSPVRAAQSSPKAAQAVERMSASRKGEVTAEKSGGNLIWLLILIAIAGVGGYFILQAGILG